MPPAYGATPAGFVVKPQSAILADMQAQVLATINPQFDLSPATPDGQFLAIHAAESAAKWELLQICYNQFNRQDVEGAGADNIGALTGTPREGASFTQVYAACTLLAGTYAAGELIANVAGNPSLAFSNVSSVVVSAAGLSGAVEVNNGQAQCFFANPQNLPAGAPVVFASQPGVVYFLAFELTGTPTPTAILTTPYTGTTAATTATSSTLALFQCLTAGPTPTINPGTLTAIATAVTGWSAVTNPLAQSQLGTNAELDAPYLGRQAADLGAEGTCTSAALTAALNELGAAQEPPITLTANVLENTLDTPVTYGSLVLPGHTYAPVVYDSGTGWALGPVGQPLILGLVYKHKPAGIVSVGTTSGSVPDANLGPQIASYSVPVNKPLFVTMYVVLRPGVTLATATAAIQAALVAAAVAPTTSTGLPPVGQLAPGAPVVQAQLIGVVMSVPAVADILTLGNVVSLFFSFSPNPIQVEPLVLLPTQVATIAQATSGVNIQVNQQPGP